MDHGCMCWFMNRFFWILFLFYRSYKKVTEEDLKIPLIFGEGKRVSFTVSFSIFQSVRVWVVIPGSDGIHGSSEGVEWGAELKIYISCLSVSIRVIKHSPFIFSRNTLYVLSYHVRLIYSTIWGHVVLVWLSLSMHILGPVDVADVQLSRCFYCRTLLSLHIKAGLWKPQVYWQCSLVICVI